MKGVKNKNGRFKSYQGKIKKVANAWTEISSLSSDAFYDVNDTNAKWNKTITFEEAEDFVKQKVTIDTPKPTAKDETRPKKPKKISAIGIFLIVYFGLSMIGLSVGFFSDMSVRYTNLLLFYIFNIIVFAILTVGICLKISYKNKCLYNETLNLSTPKQNINIIGTILIILSCCLFFLCFAEESIYVIESLLSTDMMYNNLGIMYLGLILFEILVCLGVCLVFSKANSYKVRLLKYENNLQICEENIKYNNEQLQKDIEEYENYLKSLYDEELNKINSTHKKIGEEFSKIEEIDIVSKSQAKYAQQLLDYIYKDSEIIKEAFEELDKHKEEIDNQITETQIVEKQNNKIQAHKQNTDLEKDNNKDKPSNKKANQNKDFISTSPLNLIQSILLILVRGFLGGVRLQAQISNENGFYTVYFNKDGLTLRHLTKVCKIKRDNVISCKLVSSVKLEKYRITLKNGYSVVLTADPSTKGQQDSYNFLAKSLGADVME